MMVPFLVYFPVLMFFIASPVEGKSPRGSATRTEPSYRAYRSHSSKSKGDKLKQDENFERRKKRKKNCYIDEDEESEDGDTFPPTSTWSPTITPVPSITSFPSTTPLKTLAPFLPLQSGKGKKGCTDAPSEVPSEPPSETPSNLPTTSPTDTPSDIPSTSPSETPSDIPTTSSSETPSNPPNPSTNVVEGSNEVPSFQSPSDSRPSPETASFFTVFPTANSPSEFTSPSLPLDEITLACRSQREGKVYQTSQSMNIVFVYELLLDKEFNLADAVDYLEASVQAYLTPKFISCPNKRLLHGTLGLQVEMGTQLNGSCNILSAANARTEECFLIEGTVQLFTSINSEMVPLAATSTTYNLLNESFNEDEKSLQASQSKSTFVDSSEGILGLHFRGFLSDDEVLTTGDNFAANKQSVTVIEARSMSVVGIAMIAAACVSVIVLGVFVLERNRIRSKEKSLVELTDSDDSTLNESLPNDRIRIVGTCDTSAIDALPSLFDVDESHEQSFEIENALPPIFINHRGEVLSSSFFKARPYYVSDTVDL